MVNAVKMLGLAMYVYAEGHNGEFPTNVTQMPEEIGGVIEKPEGLTGDTNSIAGVPLGAIEFVNAGIASRKYPQMIILRERFPRANPDGTWQCNFCLADGSVHTITSPDGNFDFYEKQQHNMARREIDFCFQAAKRFASI